MTSRPEVSSNTSPSQLLGSKTPIASSTQYSTILTAFSISSHEMAGESSLTILLPRYYHPAMIDAAHLSINAIILIVVIIIIALLISCCWCYCCCRRRRKRAKKRAQNWFKSPQSKKRKVQLPDWISRRGKPNANGPQRLDEVELPHYSSSSLGKSDFEEVVVPKKVHKKGWRIWRKGELH